MNELDIQGKKYISSKRAAEITGYAKDYVGQLARQGKVPATRVGRAWYVDEEAIILHSQGKSTEDFPQNQRLEIPVHAPKTSLHSLQAGSMKRNVLNTWGNINYSEVDEDLMPNLSQKEEVVVEEKPEETKIQIRRTDVAHIKPTGHAIEGVKVKTNDLPQVSTYAEPKKQTESILLLAPATLALMGIFIAGWGIFMPSAWSFNGEVSNMIASAGNIPTDYIFSYFIEIFDGGVSLIASFLGLLLVSLSDFFNLGLDFLIHLF